jgi:hypothetical protein
LTQLISSTQLRNPFLLISLEIGIAEEFSQPPKLVENDLSKVKTLKNYPAACANLSILV